MKVVWSIALFCALLVGCQITKQTSIESPPIPKDISVQKIIRNVIVLPPESTNISVTLTWDAPTGTMKIAGYWTYWGGKGQAPTNKIFTTTMTSTVSNILDGPVYTFTVASMSTSGVQSDLSATVDYPFVNTSVFVYAPVELFSSGAWKIGYTSLVFSETNPPAPAHFFKNSTNMVLEADSVTGPWFVKTNFPSTPAAPSRVNTLYLISTNF